MSVVLPEPGGPVRSVAGARDSEHRFTAPPHAGGSAGSLSDARLVLFRDQCTHPLFCELLIKTALLRGWFLDRVLGRSNYLPGFSYP